MGGDVRVQIRITQEFPVGRRRPSPYLGLRSVRREPARSLEAAPHLQGLTEVSHSSRKAGTVIEVDCLREVAPEAPLHEE
eukprot:11531305-Alexandrium_andersonii.AAC.1